MYVNVCNYRKLVLKKQETCGGVDGVNSSTAN
jgi:hypothetical protein